MRKKLLKMGIIALLVVVSQFQVRAQCTISGLQSCYFLNGAPSTLSASTSGSVFTGVGVVGSTFNPSVAGVGTWTVSYGVCNSSYTQAAIIFSPTAFTGSNVTFTTSTSYDDQVSAGVPIGFNFQFFCTTYSVVYVSTNGFITFNINNALNNASGCCSGGFIPTGTTPDCLIAAAWTDLNLNTGGSITYTTVGTAPFRRFIVSYNGVNHYSPSGTLPVTSQIILYETTNVIEIHTTSKPSSSSTTTQGIMNLGGTVGYAPLGRNASSTWSATNDAYRYIPGFTSCGSATTTVINTTLGVSAPVAICSGNSATITVSGTGLSYQWSGGSSSTSGTIVVNPTSNTNYSLTASNGSGCSINTVVALAVNPGVPTMTLTPSSPSICIGKTVTLTATGALTYTWAGGIPNGGTVTPTGTTSYSVTGTNACGNSTAAITITASPIPVGLAATPTLVCAGSAATINAVAAATSYTWSSNSQNQSSITVAPTANTIYSVAVSDGTCFGSGTVAIAASPVPTISIAASSSVLCQGYSATLTASGASGYTWNPGNLNTAQIVVNPSSATLYSVVGSNSVNCTSLAQQVILTQPSPTLVPTISNTLSCVNETVTISLTGASTYTWSNGMTGNSNVVTVPSSTSIVITGIGSNSCTSNYTANLTVFDPTVSVTGGTAVCAGKSTTLTGSGADTYNWVNGLPFASQPVTPSVTTTYTLSTTTASDGVTCSKNVTYTVVVNSNPTITTTPSVVTLCVKSEQATLTASGASSYLWSGSNGTLSSNASNTFTYNVAGTYVYSVTGTDANGCVSTKTVSIKANSCTGLNEMTGVTGVEVYPNPNNGEFTVKSSIETDMIMVNQLGQVIREFHLNGNVDQKINVTGIAEGVYYLKSKNSDNFSQKIIVTH